MKLNESIENAEEFLKNKIYHNVSSKTKEDTKVQVNKLIKDILDLSKIEVGNLTPEELFVLRSFLGFYGNGISLTTKNIADALGVSVSQVSEIYKRTIKKLHVGVLLHEINENSPIEALGLPGGVINSLKRGNVFYIYHLCRMDSGLESFSLFKGFGKTSYQKVAERMHANGFFFQDEDPNTIEFKNVLQENDGYSLKNNDSFKVYSNMEIKILLQQYQALLQQYQGWKQQGKELEEKLNTVLKAIRKMPNAETLIETTHKRYTKRD